MFLERKLLLVFWVCLVSRDFLLWSVICMIIFILVNIDIKWMWNVIKNIYRFSFVLVIESVGMYIVNEVC